MRDLNGAHVTVLGGLGFIGVHLCQRLLVAGAQVCVIDSGITSGPGNLIHLLRANAGDRLRVYTDDISYAPQNPTDAVINLASAASPRDYQARRVHTLTTAAEGTRRWLMFAHQLKVPFLMASTSEVYGDPEVSPQPETYRGNVDSTGPRSCYDEGKRYAEALCAAAAVELDADVRIARIFNTYGPRMRHDDGRLVPEFIEAVKADRPLPIRGTGLQTRSLCYINDMVGGLIRLLMSDVRIPVNLGHPREVTVLHLADLVWSLMGGTGLPPLQFTPDPIGDDPQRRCPDITRAREMLGWSPTTSLVSGLRTTIAAWEGTHVDPPKEGP